MVEKYLLEGKQNAVASQALADLVGCGSVRELQEIIAKERAAGTVILSTCGCGGGYFLPIPGERHEVVEYIQTLRSRAKNTLVAIESAEAYLRQLDGARE